MTMFTPKNFKSFAEAHADMGVFGAHSDTVVNGREVFGWVDNNPVFATEVFDEVSGEFWTVADE